uniref:Uncharacterized protein n=1 Tax=Cacopsylla melanoneura TaxID=428564 RepID=A0A8D8YS27_9HEMI
MSLSLILFPPMCLTNPLPSHVSPTHPLPSQVSPNHHPLPSQAFPLLYSHLFVFSLSPSTLSQSLLYFDTYYLSLFHQYLAVFVSVVCWSYYYLYLGYSYNHMIFIVELMRLEPWSQLTHAFLPIPKLYSMVCFG